MRLIDYKNNIYSEDGVLEKIFSLLSPALNKNKWCVEFGAWDGKYTSNTFHLIESGWDGVYIEGDQARYKDLLATSSENTKIIPICAFVGHGRDDENNLDNILARTEIPNDFELLSIDIDSFDLDVWNTFSGSPKVVIIEINSSVMPGVLQWHDGKKFIGNSFIATLNCGTEKGYKLVCHTGNMIFVRDDLMHFIGIDDIDLAYPERLFVSDWVIEIPSTSIIFRLGKAFLPKSLKNIIKKLFLMKKH